MKLALLLSIAVCPLAADVNSTVYIPHIATGGTWNTVFTIVNLLPLQTGQGTLHFWAEDGSPLSVALAGTSGAQSQMTITVPPNGVATVETAGDPNALTTVGWADFDVLTPGPLIVSALMRRRIPGQPDYESSLCRHAASR